MLINESALNETTCLSTQEQLASSQLSFIPITLVMVMKVSFISRHWTRILRTKARDRVNSNRIGFFAIDKGTICYKIEIYLLGPALMPLFE